jgi:hypothetical protein
MSERDAAGEMVAADGGLGIGGGLVVRLVDLQSVRDMIG